MKILFCNLVFILLISAICSSSVKNTCHKITLNVLFSMNNCIKDIPFYKFEKSAAINAVDAIKMHFKSQCRNELTAALATNKIMELKKSQKQLEVIFRNICTASMFSVYHSQAKTNNITYLSQIVKSGVMVLRSIKTETLITSLIH